MLKSGLKTGGHHATVSALEVKRSKILQKFNKGDCFCLHSWFYFYLFFVFFGKTILNRIIYYTELPYFNEINFRGD